MVSVFRKNARNIILACIAIYIVGHKLVYHHFPIPFAVRFLFHRIVNPSDLREPIVLDFDWTAEGFTKTYPLNPKYLDLYTIGIRGEVQKERDFPNGPGIPPPFEFSGILKLEFFHKNKLLSQETLTNTSGMLSGLEKTTHILSLLRIPIDGYIDDLTVKVTLVKPDPRTARFQVPVAFFIGIAYQ